MKKKTAFTLIELMVAITIGMLVVSFGAVALNDFNEKQKVEAVRQELLADLRLARTYAMTEQFPSGIVDDHNDNTKVVMAVVVVNKTIEIRARDGNSFNQLITSKNITPDNISVNFGVGNSVAFSISDGRSINGVVNIGVSGNDVIKNIIIDDSGLIYEQ